MNRRKGIVSISLLIAIDMLATACHTMKPVSPWQLTASWVGPVWVTKTDSSKFIMQAPRVNGDTLGGWVDGEYREMPLSETTKLIQRAPDRGRTVAVGVTTAVTMLLGFVYMANRSYVGDGQTCYRASNINEGQAVPCCAGKSTIAC